ncbi:MAG: hypothetical protein ABSF61_06550 [Anaerolineales bacterium]|jgi:hypothetical protein
MPERINLNPRPLEGESASIGPSPKDPNRSAFPPIVPIEKTPPPAEHGQAVRTQRMPPHEEGT